MGAVADLQFFNAPVGDPVATARFIGGLILTRRQKAALLKDYLIEKGVVLDESIRAGAAAYADQL